MKSLVSILLVLLSCSGCLWVCRIPVPVKSSYSDDGECTNRVWKSMVTQCREQRGTNCIFYGVYPLTKMRWNATHFAFKGVKTDGLNGKELYEAKMRNRWMWLPGLIIWLGEPLDFVVDTVLIPYDL